MAGDFAGDAALNVAIIHASSASASTPFGGVTVLRGDGAGVLELQPHYYQVGALPIDSVTADFNGDGRADLAVANFSSNSISILLGQADGTFNVQSAILGTASGAFDIAVGDVDNFDNDISGPNATGTVNIVTIPQQTDTLHVLRNKLVNGTHRVILTGTNRVTGMDFIIKSAVLAPQFNNIANPTPIVEDAPEQTVTITGITKGRASGPLSILADRDDSITFG